MKQVFAGFIALIFLIALLLGADWLFTGNDFFLYQYFAPRQAAVERKIFEQSKSYNQGMVQELSSMQFEYVKAAPEQQAAMASMILHRAADYDIQQLPPDLRSFIGDLRRERTTPTTQHSF